MNNLNHNEYPFPENLEQDQVTEYIACGLRYSIRGLATAVLAPLDLLKHLQEGLGAEPKAAATWIASAVMYLFGAGVWRLVATENFSGRSADIFVLVLGMFGVAIVLGWLQRDRTRAKLNSMLKLTGRAA